MKFERLVSHDFLIVASVLLLSALFNKTIMNVVGSYEAFAAAATTTTTTTNPSTSQATVATLKDIADAQSWRTFLSSKAFWFPNLTGMLTIVGFFIWLFIYIFKKTKSPSSF